jgi:hypothetical protein
LFEDQSAIKEGFKRGVGTRKGSEKGKRKKSLEESRIMDSVFTAVHRNVILVDLVDEAWAADHLSDDGEE